ncbi:DUF3316 domain-containing protein [Vibrio methylphosphonaticus]|uniref:DUF3316 domain-containing protein n=1 Tax=Vibrio methylphosphonaticus TaxID=2946866 RepID=UPI00202A0ABC|nr:DUF3316 domain-containing protein [Vibrio methylphosphonaticus]MCL9776422.1 DUF3316 domain-containing protein [Vibrio methylphosphonaticus]
MKKRLVVACVALMSGSVFAGSDIGNSHLETEAFQSKQQAYEAGYQLVDELNEMTNGALAHQLHLNAHSDNIQDIELKNTEVSVHEYSEKQGVIKYRAQVNVSYEYDAKDS